MWVLPQTDWGSGVWVCLPQVNSKEANCRHHCRSRLKSIRYGTFIEKLPGFQDRWSRFGAWRLISLKFACLSASIETSAFEIADGNGVAALSESHPGIIDHAAEGRQLTVVFCDLAGSTEMSLQSRCRGYVATLRWLSSDGKKNRWPLRWLCCTLRHFYRHEARAKLIASDVLNLSTDRTFRFWIGWARMIQAWTEKDQLSPQIFLENFSCGIEESGSKQAQG